MKIKIDSSKIALFLGFLSQLFSGNAEGNQRNLIQHGNTTVEALKALVNNLEAGKFQPEDLFAFLAASSDFIFKMVTTGLIELEHLGEGPSSSGSADSNGSSTTPAPVTSAPTV